MKQEERREQTKRILLEATEELIREQGASRTTLNDIMKRSGLSKGLFFIMFQARMSCLSSY